MKRMTLIAAVMALCPLALNAEPSTDLQFSALVDVGFMFHVGSNPVDVDENAGDFVLRPFYREDETFTVGLAQLGMSKAAAPLGFGLKLDFFETAQALEQDAGADDIEVQEAHIIYNPEFLPAVLDGATLTAGKVTSLLGHERIEATGRWTMSRGLLATGGAPMTHLGLRTEWPAIENLNLIAGVNNGDDADVDQDRGLGLEAGASYRPVESLLLKAAGVFSLDLPSDEGDRRWIIDVAAAYDPLEYLSAWAEFLYGQTDDAILLDGSEENSTFWSVAAAVQCRFMKRFGITGRAEYFSDENTHRFTPGFSRIVPGLYDDTTESLYLWELTVVGHFWVTESIEVRVEGRCDKANRQIFHDDDTDGLHDSCGTIGIQVLYRH